jgi:hypothetical protein
MGISRNLVKCICPRAEEEILVGEHDALWSSRCAGCVDQNGNLCMSLVFNAFGNGYRVNLGNKDFGEAFDEG